MALYPDAFLYAKSPREMKSPFEVKFRKLLIEIEMSRVSGKVLP